jgi:hypothetical protein
MLDTLNFWRTSLKNLGESLGIKKLEMPGNQTALKDWHTYCERDVDITAVAIDNLIKFILDHNLGSFAMTAPSLALKAFKHRFMMTTQPTKEGEEMEAWDRESYHGGLVHNFFIGKVKRKTIYHFDINSLYPSVMLNTYPTKLEFVLEQVSLARLNRLALDYAICAQVDIDSKQETYPYYDGTKLLECRGKFTTALCGAELLAALSRGHIAKVRTAAFYIPGLVFNSYVDFFWRKRQEYKKKGNAVYEQFCKLLMNSLYGKFAQSGYEWQELNEPNLRMYYKERGKRFPAEYRGQQWEPALSWGQDKWFPLGLDEGLRIRCFSGVVQFKAIDTEHYESSPIIASYVTSYARDKLRQMIAIAGAEHCYYCDTDSLFVDKYGKARLDQAKLIDPNRLGYLKFEGEAYEPLFLGPKDYVFGDKRKIKGIRDDAIQIGEGEYVQNIFEGLKSVLNRTPDPYIKIAWVVKQLRREYNKGIVLPSGRVVNFTLNQ